MRARHLIFVGCVGGALAIACGAFGAHGLARHLSAKQLETWHTGATYHFYHVFAVLLYGLWLDRRAQPRRTWPGLLFVSGTVLFSGSLYLLAVTGLEAIALVTPVGGLLLLVAWLGWAWQAGRSEVACGALPAAP